MLPAGIEGLSLFLAQSASSTQAPPNPSGAIWIIVAIVCVAQRKQEIGGWLLLYYVQLYFGLLFLLIVLAATYENYLPGTWAGSPGRYALHLFSTVPAFVVQIVQLVVSERLRRSRDHRHLATLRRILWINVALLAVSSAIDFGFFPESIVFGLIALVWPLIWLPYFHVSKRVERVFVSKTWLRPPLDDTTPASPPVG